MAGAIQGLLISYGSSVGDLLIVVIGSPSDTFTWPAGWTQIFAPAAASGTQIEARYRVATGSEGPTITITSSGSVRSSFQAFRFTGYSATPEGGTSTGTSASMDPPNLTPSWGSAANLWVALGAEVGNAGSVGTPTNYSSGSFTGGTTGGQGGIFSATRALTATSEDPGGMSMSGGSANWCAGTVAVKPASGTPTMSNRVGTADGSATTSHVVTLA